MPLSNKITKIAIYFIFLIVFFLGSIEISMMIGFFKPSFSMNDLEFYLDRKILYKVKPNVRKDINSFGYRNEEFNKKSSNKRVLFFGDSFIMGLNVAPEQTIPKFLEKKLGTGYEVFNMGICGYGPDQSLVDFEEKKSEFDSEFLILSIFPANDFEDITENRLFFIDENNRLHKNKNNIVAEEIPKLNFLYLYEYLLYKYELLSEESPIMEKYRSLFKGLVLDDYELSLMIDINSDDSQNKIKLMKSILSKFKELSDEGGEKKLVLIIPSYENIHDDTPFKSIGISSDRYFVNELVIQNLCNQIGMPCLNLYPLFLQSPSRYLLYDPADHHLSPTGNKFVAEAIVNFMAEKKYISKK